MRTILKILVLLLFLFLMKGATAQSGTAQERVIARSAFYLKDTWFDGVVKDTALFNQVSKIPTGAAVWNHINSRLAGYIKLQSGALTQQTGAFSVSGESYVGKLGINSTGVPSGWTMDVGGLARFKGSLEIGHSNAGNSGNTLYVNGTTKFTNAGSFNVDGVSFLNGLAIIGGNQSNGKQLQVTGAANFRGLATFETAPIGLYNASSDPTGAAGYMYHSTTIGRPRYYTNAWNSILLSGDVTGGNGLTGSGNTIKLGGILTENTTINTELGNTGNNRLFTIRAWANSGYRHLDYQWNDMALRITDGGNNESGGRFGVSIGKMSAYGVFSAGAQGSNLNGFGFGTYSSQYARGFHSYIKHDNNDATTSKGAIGVYSVVEVENSVTTRPMQQIWAGYFKATNANTTPGNGTPFAIYSDGGVNYFKDSIYATGNVRLSKLTTTGTAPNTTGETKPVFSDGAGNLTFKNWITADWNAAGGDSLIRNKPTQLKAFVPTYNVDGLQGTGNGVIAQGFRFAELLPISTASNLTVGLSPAGGAGNAKTIINRNTNPSYSWQFADGTNVYYADGTQLITIPNGAVLEVLYTGTDWVVTNEFKHVAL